MCEYCEELCYENTILGADIKIHKCANRADLTIAQIMKHASERKPGIVIYQGNLAKGHFEINYCPMCGRKLVEE